MIRGGAVLCYHALTGGHMRSASPANVPAEEFRATVTALGRVATIVPLSELVARHRAGRSIRGLLAVTFDDAYASLASLAGDWIRERGVPITVFVTDRASASGAAFWWDRVEDLAAQAPPARWERFLDEVGVPAAYRMGHGSAGPFRPIRQWVLSEHRGRWPAAAEPILDTLERELGYRTPQRAMTFTELADFAAYAPVEYAVHTVTHPVLPRLADAELVREIEDSYANLRDRLPAVHRLLAFPYGHFDARTIRLARDAGMQASFSLANRVVRGREEDGLPRFGMSRGARPLRTLLRVIGAWELIAGSRTPEPPVLPSATT